MSQSYANHRQLTPLYHYFTSPLGGIFIVWAGIRAFHHPNADSAFFLVGALALGGAIATARMAALRVQDRMIRFEERVRLQRILPADLQASVDSIRTSHLIAMRFASDEEIPALVRQVLANPSIKASDIKKQIRHWRPDTFRV